MKYVLTIIFLWTAPPDADIFIYPTLFNTRLGCTLTGELLTEPRVAMAGTGAAMVTFHCRPVREA